MSNTKRCKHSKQNKQAKQQDKQEKQGEWLVRSNNNQIHDEEEKGSKQCRDSLDAWEKRKGHLMSRRRRVAVKQSVERAQNTDTYSKQQHISPPIILAPSSTNPHIVGEEEMGRSG